MSRTYISKNLRQKVASAAHERCGYCQTQQVVVGYALHIDHILPEAAGGSSTEENLWLACSVCNNSKGTKTHGLDLVTLTRALLFNPRTQVWAQHFAWNAQGTEIQGLTPTGRATIQALKLNSPLRIQARQLWVSVGWHPPE